MTTTIDTTMHEGKKFFAHINDSKITLTLKSTQICQM